MQHNQLQHLGTIVIIFSFFFVVKKDQNTQNINPSYTHFTPNVRLGISRFSPTKLIQITLHGERDLRKFLKIFTKIETLNACLALTVRHGEEL